MPAPLNPNTDGPSPVVKFRANGDTYALAQRVAKVRGENLSERLRGFLEEYARQGEREVFEAEHAALRAAAEGWADPETARPAEKKLPEAPTRQDVILRGRARKSASLTREIKEAAPYTCSCGRLFTTKGGRTTHARSCDVEKARSAAFVAHVQAGHRGSLEGCTEAHQ